MARRAFPPDQQPAAVYACQVELMAGTGTNSAPHGSAATEAKHEMDIATTRFGSVEVPDENLIHFKSGIIGFPRETRFALIPHGQSTLIAWLQSVQTPG